MIEKRFDPKKLNKLNNPDRYKLLSPEFIVSKAGLFDPKTIIDYGAGTGFYSIPFVDMFKGVKVFAADISEIMIKWMQENLSEYENIIPIIMEDNKISLEDESADFLFMINLHHELGRPDLALKECYRLLKKGAKIAICDWKKTQMDFGPPLAIRVSPNDIKQQLLEAGFRKLEIYNEPEFNYMLIARK
jgi:ubiquinone/menaquinone biosynthesis C-methylase UbiE